MRDGYGVRLFLMSVIGAKRVSRFVSDAITSLALVGANDLGSVLIYIKRVVRKSFNGLLVCHR